MPTLLTRPTLDVNLLHLSDLYVTTREIVRLARQFAQRPGDLPPDSPPAQNVMVSRYLSELGITLGGVPLLEKTVSQLVNAAT